MEAQLAHLQETLRSAQDGFGSMLAFFGENAASFAYDLDFWRDVIAFVHSFTAAQRALEQQRKVCSGTGVFGGSMAEPIILHAAIIMTTCNGVYLCTLCHALNSNQPFGGVLIKEVWLLQENERKAGRQQQVQRSTPVSHSLAVHILAAKGLESHSDDATHLDPPATSALYLKGAAAAANPSGVPGDLASQQRAGAIKAKRRATLKPEPQH